LVLAHSAEARVRLVDAVHVPVNVVGYALGAWTTVT
jgi:hypothetical protein